MSAHKDVVWALGSISGLVVSASEDKVCSTPRAIARAAPAARLFAAPAVRARRARHRDRTTRASRAAGAVRPAPTAPLRRAACS